MKNIPKIIVPFNDKQRFKDLVLNVIQDSWIYSVTPDFINLDGVLFTLTLSNKKFVFEEMKVDNLSDYIDVYLQGIKKSSDIYVVTDNGNDIIISFNQTITLRPQEIVKEDFLVKGKIVNR